MSNTATTSQTIYVNNVPYIVDPTYTATSNNTSQTDYQYRTNVVWSANNNPI
jgi:hypothetical protein